MHFEWDARKAAANWSKHGVSFEEARSVFFDDLAVQFDDRMSLVGEPRFILLGMSALGRVLVVVHAERAAGEVIRIISARRATARERRSYRGFSQ